MIRLLIFCKQLLTAGIIFQFMYVLFPVFATAMALLPDTYNCGLRTHRECRERFPHHHWLTIPVCTMARAVTHMPGCMPGSLTHGFLWRRWRGKRSRHSRRMRNPQFYISGKRPILHAIPWNQRPCCDDTWCMVVTNVAEIDIWGVDYLVKYMLKSTLINNDFPIWLLIG